MKTPGEREGGARVVGSGLPPVRSVEEMSASQGQVPWGLRTPLGAPPPFGGLKGETTSATGLMRLISLQRV